MKIANLHIAIDPMTSKNRSRPSIFELAQDTPYIHGISLGPMWLIFAELSCLQAKCWWRDRHANLIVGLVTCNPPNKRKCMLNMQKFFLMENRHLRNICAVYPDYDSLSNDLKVTILLNSYACMHPKCERTNLEVAARNFIYSIHCHCARILNTAPA